MTPLTPFSYSVEPHLRRHNPQGYRDYTTYKDWLRDDFVFRCVYCLERELWALSRQAAFSVEHVKAKATCPELECTYTNLVYACIRCNVNKRMVSLLDPCEAGLGNHIAIENDMRVRAISTPGGVLIGMLHLNEDPALFNRRKYRAIHELFRKYPDDDIAKSLFESSYCYPADLPDLSQCRPVSNPLQANISESHFARRSRGALPRYY